MKVICSAFITIIDMNDITSSPTAPTNPTDGMLWMDTSETPPILKVWQNGKWEIVDDETVGTTNLLKNTGLRKDGSHWSFASGITRDTNKKKGSNNSLKYQVTGLTSDSWRSGNPEYVEIDIYKRYSAACEVFIPVNHGIDKGISLEVQWFDASGTRVRTNTISPDLSLTDRWQRLKIERLRAPSNAVKANARVWVRQNGSFYVADMILSEGAKVGSWVAHKDDIKGEMDDTVNDALVAQTQEDIFNKLTNNGASQGIFIDENKNFYINGEYIRGENLNIVRHSDKESTFKVDSVGEVEINAKKLTIKGSSVATGSDVQTAIGNIDIGVRNLLLGTSKDYKTITMGDWNYSIGDFTLTSKDLKVGDSVAFKLYLKFGSVFCGGAARFTFYNSAGENIKTVSGDMINKNAEGFSQVITTIPTGAARVWVGIQKQTAGEGTSSVELQYRMAKLERGTKCSGWTPAPEDAENAYTIVLGNEAQVIPTNSSRVPAASKTYYTDVTVYQGTTQRNNFTIGKVNSANGITVSQTSTRVNFAVSTAIALSADDGLFTIPITIDGKTFQKTFSWACSKQGSTGAAGSNGTNGTNGAPGKDGVNGTNGADAYTVVLTNESHAFVSESNGSIPSALTTTSNVISYKGASSVSPTITKPSNPAGLELSVSGSTITIKALAGSSLADSGSVTFPIAVDGKTFNKVFSWTKTRKGATGATGATGAAGTNGTNGTNGVNAKSADIIPSSLVFKSTDGGITFAPSTITLTPKLQYVNFSSWQYSTNGGSSWNGVTSGQNGLSISNNVLTVSKDSSLYTKTTTAISFRLNTNDSTMYDVVTVIKLYDPNEMTQEQVFNKLTNGGTEQGIFLDNSKVYLNGQYIKANTIVADDITSGTFKGTNFEAGGSGKTGLIISKDATDEITFRAGKDGVYATNISFPSRIDANGAVSTSVSLNISNSGLKTSSWESGTLYYQENSAYYECGGATFGERYTSNDGGNQTTTTKAASISGSGLSFSSSSVNMSLGLSGAYLVLTGRQIIHNDGNVHRYQTKTAGGTLYTDWYTDSKGTTRSAWMGYGTANNKNFAISVENGGELHLSGNGGVVMKSALNMETRAIHNVWKITGMYNNGTIIADHNNKNVEVGALGGTLFLGHTTTTGVQVSSAFYTQGDSYLKGNVRYTGSNYGDNYIMMAGTGDGNSYTACNVRMRLHYGLGFATNDGTTVNCVIDSRGGRFIGKSAYWHNSSKALKSDVRSIVSSSEPMVAKMAHYDTVDSNVSIEMIEDFLDSINVKTYISDFKQEGITQDEHDDSKGHIKQLGYIADEFCDHPLFPYIGEMIGEYHAINSTALTSAVIAGYQVEKRKRLELEYQVSALKTEALETKNKLDKLLKHLGLTEEII